MYKLSLLDKASIILVIIGALNWGILGISNLNIIEELVGYSGKSSSSIERIIYILIGVAALNLILLIFKSKNKSKSSK